MVEILGVQIIGILFGVFMLYYSFLHYKRREFKIGEYFFWALLWLLFIIVTIAPELLNPIRDSFSFARTLDMFIIFGFLFLIGITFYMYSVTKRNQNKIEAVVREIAIKKAKEKK